MEPSGPVVFVVVLLTAGCLGPGLGGQPPAPAERTLTAIVDSGIAPANRSAQQVYVVLIEGSEQAKRLGASSGESSVCDLAWAYDLDRAAKTLRYDGHRYPLDVKTLQILVLTNYHAPSLGRGIGEDCASKVAMASYAGRASFHGSVREDLPVDLVVEAQNGFLTHNTSHFVPVGKKVHVNFVRLEEPAGGRYEVTGDYEVVNLGAWNRTALEPRA